MPKLSIVVPCFNEADVLTVTYERIVAAATNAVGGEFELIFINDGSIDQTWSIIERFTDKDERVVGMNLSRNFGHQIAVTAGLEQARGDRVLIIDADLQDPPELLKQMMETMDAEQADVVYGQRTKRGGESAFKLATAAAFYRLFRWITDINMPADTGDFRLISRRVAETLRKMPEQQRFLRGMVAWIGFRQVAFPYERAERYAGVTNYPLKKMLRFSIDAFTGFSLAPLRFATLLSVIAACMSIFIASYIAVSLTIGNVVAGWASVMMVVSFFGTIQLLVLGIMGEYIGRLMLESKHRPLYLVNAVARKQAPE